MKTIVENLVCLGESRIVATVVSLLSDETPRSMRDIEREADLRQPDVSLAVKELALFVGVAEKRDGSTGRPQKVITMTKDGYAGYLNALSDRIAAKQQEWTVALSELSDGL